MSALAIVLLVSAVTILLRLLPVYVLGQKGRELPGPLVYLSRVMPPAIMGFLVVYSVKSVDVLRKPHGLPELAGILTAAVLHHYRRNTLLSVFGATALYMVLVRVL